MFRIDFHLFPFRHSSVGTSNSSVCTSNSRVGTSNSFYAVTARKSGSVEFKCHFSGSEACILCCLSGPSATVMKRAASLVQAAHFTSLGRAHTSSLSSRYTHGSHGLRRSHRNRDPHFHFCPPPDSATGTWNGQVVRFSCLCVRERERERERGGGRERDTDRQTDREHTHTHTHTHTH